MNTAPTMNQSTDNTSMKPIEKTKRKQVKNACVNCQKACKKCDDGRPCKRCIKLGLTATCRDSDRKERKKGVKRGPYKKRQAYIKDKPVFPKVLTEQDWKAPIYEHNVPQISQVPQVPSHAIKVESPVQFLEDFYVPSQQQQPQHQQHGFPLSSLSPTSLSSFVDESDETLHYAYGYNYTNSTITTTSSPSATSMLDHQAISGNVTPLQDEFYSWDDIENYSVTASPIGYNPIVTNHTSVLSDPIIQFQAYPTSNFEYNCQQQKDQIPAVTPLSSAFDLDLSSVWFNNTDMSLSFTTTSSTIPQTQHYFEYNIPTQQQQQSQDLHYHQDNTFNQQLYF
ncbi:hypothetical protein MAM1_0069d04077 [Mucor ambiguus]|uniref:Zn(2)-C6 fungal-type domain-containing protein n=1 Tax=Mucor ambiguus TaxID=91626 RepID=A0A0C9M552_9FUNG|nr:hypothetical protein MAM1_0069d04077 [Mucor ambiguus]